jgi:hypothetical protein
MQTIKYELTSGRIIAYFISTTIYYPSLLLCPSAWELSRDIQVDAGFVLDKAPVLRDTINGTFYILFKDDQNLNYTNPESWQNFTSTVDI